MEWRSKNPAIRVARDSKTKNKLLKDPYNTGLFYFVIILRTATASGLCRVPNACEARDHGDWREAASIIVWGRSRPVGGR